MRVKIKMPDLATTDSTVKVVRWLVEVDRPVRRGEPLLEVETDKAVMEVESFVTGTLKAVHAQPNNEVEAGQVIATLHVESHIPSAALPTEQTLTPTYTSAPTDRRNKTPKPLQQPIRTPRKAGGMFAKNRNRRARQPTASDKTTHEGEKDDSVEN